MLAAGVLAFSTASPAVVLAQEPDQQEEGAAMPEPGAAAEPPAEPVFDPGGGSTEVPFDAAPEPEAPTATMPPVDDDAGALESEPVTDDAAPTADAGDGSGTQVARSEGPAPAAETVVPATGVITPSQGTSETVPNPASPATDDHASAHEDEPAGTPRRGRPVDIVALATPDPPPDPGDAGARLAEPTPPAQTDAGAGGGASVPVAQAQPAATAAPAPQAQVEASPPATVRTTSAATKRQAAKRGDPSHVVRPGESLWSIAGDLLGDEASTARIAREVNRLWELNRSRIATGNPDLLAIGTKLVLR